MKKLILVALLALQIFAISAHAGHQADTAINDNSDQQDDCDGIGKQLAVDDQKLQQDPTSQDVKDDILRLKQEYAYMNCAGPLAE